MTYTCRMWALSALALTLVLGACSTPDDLTTPTLEPQFGTRGYDAVEEVAYSKAGYLYAAGSWNGSEEYHDKDIFLRRYDRSGNLVWESFFDAEPAYQDYPYKTYGLNGLAVDGTGNAYVAWSVYYSDGNEIPFSQAYLTKFSPSGKVSYRVATPAWTQKMVVDGSGNVYAFTGSSLVKYSPTGARLWQKTGFSGINSLTMSSASNIYTVDGNGVVKKYSSSTGALIWSKKVLPSSSEVSNGACEAYWCSHSVSYEIRAGLSDEFHILGGKWTEDFDGDSCSGYEQNVTFSRFSKDGVRQVQKSLLTLWRYDCGYIEQPSGPSGWTQYEATTDSLGNTYIATSLYDDGRVIKVSRAGTVAWSKGFGTASFDVALDVATFDGSEVFVGGMTKGFLVHRQLGKGDALLREMNSSGAQVWTR